MDTRKHDDQWLKPVALLCAAYALGMIHRSLFGGLSHEAGTQLGISLTDMAWIGSLYAWAFFLSQIPVGVVIDAVGFRGVAIASAACLSLGSLAFGLAHGPWMLGLSRVLVAIGSVSALHGLLSFFAFAYHDKSARPVGRALGFGNASSVLAGVPALALLSLFDWRAMLLGLAVLAGCVALGLASTLPKAHAENKGAGFLESSKAFYHAFRQREVVVAFMAIAGVAGAFVAFFSFGAPIISHVAGLSRQEESWLVSGMPLGFGLGMVLWSGGATHRARARAYALAPLAALAIWLGLAYAVPKSGIVLALSFFFIGVFSANFPSVLDALDLFARPGARTSMKAAANSGVAVGSGVGQMLLASCPPGWIYVIGAAFCIVGLVAGSLLYAKVMARKAQLAKMAEELMGAGVRGVLAEVAVRPRPQSMSIDDLVVTGVAWQSDKDPAPAQSAVSIKE